FVSGLCALIFQTAWLREFRLIFGASTPASAAVLAIFMGGLGLGNAVLGRRVDRAASPLKVYALFELGISAAAAASPFLLECVRSLYFSLGGQESLGISGASMVRLLLSTLVIGVPTFLMGGTLPAAARAATSAADRARVSVGWLYGLNTIGAVVGALASTFVLLEMLGNRETLWAAAAANIVNAALAWRLAGQWSAAPAASAKRRTGGRHRPDADEPAKQSDLMEGPLEAPSWLIYAAAGLVGFAFLLMELVWYRLLGPILGGTTFTFGIILAVALAGIGIGGALYPLLYRARLPTLRDFALTCAGEALAIGLPFAAGDRLAILAAVLRGLEYFGFAGQASGWVIVAGIVIFPAALISGLQYPLLISLLGRGWKDVGKQVGQATAFNTLGAMAGSLAGGFGLLPLLSAPGAWKLTVALLAGLSLASLGIGLRTGRQAVQTASSLLAVLIAALCLLATGPTAVWRHSHIGVGRAQMPDMTMNALKAWSNAARRSIEWEADGQESSVAVSTNIGVTFIVNGKSDGNALMDAGTQIMFPMIGALIHPQPARALVIGLGTGESAGWLASLPSMQQVDVVELEPAIVNVARLCAPLNHDVLHHRKVRVIFNDGREVLQTLPAKYDLIASEPSNPYRAGVANLYTKEFYESVEARLAPRGLFVQWLQGYEIDRVAVRTVLCTLHEVFGHVEIWASRPNDLVLVCSRDPLDYPLPLLQSRIKEPAMREALRVGWRTTHLEGALAHFVANERYTAAVAHQRLGWINTDNRNVLEYSFARTVGRSLGFSVEGMREEARRQNANRPLAIDAGVDWEAVEDEKIAFHAGSGDRPLPAGLFAGERERRAAAVALIAQGDMAGGTVTWNQQSRAPTGLAEHLLLAMAYASTKDARAEPLIEKIRESSPLDADAIAGVLAVERQQYSEAGRLLTQVFQTLRTNPTGDLRAIELALIRSTLVVERDPSQAQRLYRALSQPFAVYQFDLRRRLSRWICAQHAGDAAMLETLAEFEPHVPWDRTFLQVRYAVYRRMQDPRAAQAERDLREFMSWMPEQFVLEPEGAVLGAARQAAGQ
ncbi:MAG TPA: fused MFS/spermidine synthase, partial [Pirellulaceae bacterium]|nr:fused MFS/spermidine synthase [Pirellulaceae bacterium]